jgi:putative heme-binding domain-containing protein
MALRDQFLPAATWKKLADKRWKERDARALADVSLGVPNAEAAAFLMAHLRQFPEMGEMLVNCVHHVARHGEESATKELLAFVRAKDSQNLGLQVALFRAIEQGTQERGGKLAEPVRAWAVDLSGRLLASKNDGDVQAGIGLVGSLRLESQQAKVVEMARKRGTPEGQRRAALEALANLDARRHAAVLGNVLGDADASFALREHSANLLARANQPETQAELLKVLPTAPARLQTLIADRLAGSLTGAEKLLDAVKTGKASARLLQERVVELRLKESRVPKLQERLAELTEGLPPAGKGMQDLLARRREGYLKAKKDAALGAQVFTKNCANCHQVGGQGAKIGPQLDGIGVRGLDRLLEDTLDPNRNVDQAFRLTTLNLKKGQVVSGLLLKEEGQVLVLADAQGKEVRVRKDAVDERGTSQISPMPANFSEQVPEADFYNLLAYLLTLQAKK